MHTRLSCAYALILVHLLMASVPAQVCIAYVIGDPWGCCQRPDPGCVSCQSCHADSADADGLHAAPTDGGDCVAAPASGGVIVDPRASHNGAQLSHTSQTLPPIHSVLTQLASSKTLAAALSTDRQHPPDSPLFLRLRVWRI